MPKKVLKDEQVPMFFYNLSLGNIELLVQDKWEGLPFTPCTH